MTCPHQIDVGAYLLDVLDPEERERVQAHLRACPACTRTVAEFRGLPRLLGSVSLSDLSAAEPPGEPAFRRLHRSATAARPAGRAGQGRVRPAFRRSRLLGAAAACVVVAGGAAAGVLLTSGLQHLPSVVAGSSGAVHAQARIAATGSGAAIALRLSGVESDQQCELVAVGSDGRRATASVWTATYEGTAEVTGTVPIPPDQVTRLVVRTLDGRTLVTMGP